MTIDFNVYLGIKDYELEVEYLENNEEQADRLIEMVADVLEQNKTIISKTSFISRVGKMGSKSKRFFDKKRTFNT